MTYKPDTPWWEVEGEIDDEWFPLLQASSETEGKAMLRHVIVSDDPIYERWDDFRLAEPTVERVITGRAPYDTPQRGRRRRAA